jgi:hypothetical protein
MENIKKHPLAFQNNQLCWRIVIDLNLVSFGFEVVIYY